MLRRLLYVSASVLLLTIAAAACLDFTPKLHAATQAAAPTEVAVLSGVLPHGATIPLPTYADGTQATEAECQWTVSPVQALIAGTGGDVCWFCFTSSSVYGDPASRGRVVNAFAGDSYNDPLSFGSAPSRGSANYLIVATRGADGATPARTESFGAFKARYR